MSNKAQFTGELTMTGQAAPMFSAPETKSAIKSDPPSMTDEMIAEFLRKNAERVKKIQKDEQDAANAKAKADAEAEAKRQAEKAKKDALDKLAASNNERGAFLVSDTRKEKLRTAWQAEIAGMAIPPTTTFERRFWQVNPTDEQRAFCARALTELGKLNVKREPKWADIEGDEENKILARVERKHILAAMGEPDSKAQLLSDGCDQGLLFPYELRPQVGFVKLYTGK